MATTGTWAVKVGLAQMLKGGVIMDVVTPEQATIAEEAGACAVMALERVPSDIRKDGGVARMSDPEMIRGIIAAVSIPVMAKARIGHVVEADVLQALGVEYVDESEVLTPADEAKGEAGTGDIVEAVRHMRTVQSEIRRLQNMPDDEMYAFAKEIGAPVELVRQVKREGRLPVVNFAAGGVATPSDAALMMRLGADGIFVGSGVFKSENPEKIAKAIVEATTHYMDPEVIARVSTGLGKAMPGISVSSLQPKELLATRGW